VVEIPKQVDNRIKGKGRKSIFERIYRMDEPRRVGKSVSPLPKKLTRKGAVLDGHRFFPDHFKNVLGAILIRLK
jgi:hypothetical protein